MNQLFKRKIVTFFISLIFFISAPSKALQPSAAPLSSGTLVFQANEVLTPIASTPEPLPQDPKSNLITPTSKPLLQDTKSNPIAPTSRPSQQNTNSISSSQLGLKGPFAFGVTYDHIVGYSSNIQYTQSINKNMAISVLGEYGANMYRVGTTAGFRLPAEGLLKLSIERLSEVWPFQLATGKVYQRLYQLGYGARYKIALDDNIFKNFEVGGYYSTSPDVGITTTNTAITGQPNTTLHTFAGSNAKGIDIGTKLRLSSQTQANTHLYYDYIAYNNNASSNVSGAGGSVALAHLINNQFKITTKAEVRKIYNNYQLGFSWLPSTYSHNGLELSLTGNRWIYHNASPAANYSVNLEVLFDLEKHGIGLSYCSAPLVSSNKDLASWTAAPAIHVNHVQVLSTENASPTSPPPAPVSTAPYITSISPSSYSIGDAPSPLYITITGRNFKPDSTILFSGDYTPCTPTYVDENTMTVQIWFPSETITINIRNSDDQLSNDAILNATP